MSGGTQTPPTPIRVENSQTNSHTKSNMKIDPDMTIKEILELDAGTLKEMLKIVFERQQLPPIARYIARGLDILISILFICVGNWVTIIIGLGILAYSVFILVKPNAERNSFYSDIDKVVDGISNYKKFEAGELQSLKGISEKSVEKAKLDIGKYIPRLLKVNQGGKIIAMIPFLSFRFGDENTKNGEYMSALTNGELSNFFDENLNSN